MTAVTRWTRYALALLLLASLGCSEHVLFRSMPSDAKVIVGEQPIGTTPVYYSSRDVSPKSYRIEKAGYPPVEGALATRISPGRIVGSVFTLGILLIFKSPRYFYPWIIDAQLGPGGPTVTAVVHLYDLKAAVVVEGECRPQDGACSIGLESGEQCTGVYVRENQGSTVVSGSSRSIGGSGIGVGPGGNISSGVFGVQTSQAAAGRETANMNKGVIVFRCRGNIIDCALTVEAETMRGHGECRDTTGKIYRLTLLPKGG